MLEWKKKEHRGNQALVEFENGWGASVIDDGYGSDQGLYEVAVLGHDGNIHYGNDITGDYGVEGFLGLDEVYEILYSIKALPPETTKYRLYANGNIAHEDDFREHDDSLPFYDDYWEGEVPESSLLRMQWASENKVPVDLVEVLEMMRNKE